MGHKWRLAANVSELIRRFDQVRCQMPAGALALPLGATHRSTRPACAYSTPAAASWPAHTQRCPPCPPPSLIRARRASRQRPCRRSPACRCCARSPRTRSGRQTHRCTRRTAAAYTCVAPAQAPRAGPSPLPGVLPQALLASLTEPVGKAVEAAFGACSTAFKAVNQAAKATPALRPTAQLLQFVTQGLGNIPDVSLQPSCKQCRWPAPLPHPPVSCAPPQHARPLLAAPSSHRWSRPPRRARPACSRWS